MAKPRMSQLCPCGSGKKYKDCCALKEQTRRKRVQRTKKIAKWAAACALLALAVYAVSQTSGVAFSDTDIRVVDFSVLTSQQKKSALQAANQARCTCGCGMTLAQCVATDSTCPLRSGNIQRIETMVASAKKS